MYSYRLATTTHGHLPGTRPECWVALGHEPHALNCPFSPGAGYPVEHRVIRLTRPERAVDSQSPVSARFVHALILDAGV